ncbi:hypothetical protein GJW-30_1_03436 [Variibacter gotjawalensis]|uniref:DUF2155 domain-containing protein n=1 Tax=Variibacter gotjawalensis TaxID=1333996 RepID=A0A0S3PY94_9BRAD|nr:DUF2155 domain-containing protein [Variibacter gotjawalensis]NIK46721.1 hypothetical protein [Variibacter gotjawalensis]RZS48624.1 uncharacterized protein DUF2155 [Variibacter gotjawalensis]BAT60886.1 hypothetical protein GJW-30_1_03436 [Variibacter gotjawalensis]
MTARLRLWPAALALLVATPALAQFGGIFGGPPRPPANVPGGEYQQDERLPPRPTRRQPQQREEQEPPAPPLTRLPPDQQQQPAQRGQLPPPPTTATTQPASPMQTNPNAQAPAQPPLAGLPPGQRQPRGTPQQPNSDEVVVAPPKQKIVNQTAVFSGLDKITGRIISFDVAVDETVQFGALRLTPRACFTRPPSELPNTDSFIEVDEITLNGEVKRIFTGWMFAASPGLHGVEHPIYDVWLADCKSPQKVAEAPTPAAAEPEPQAEPAARPTRQQQPRQQRPNPPPQRAQPQQAPLPPPGAPRGY